MGVLTLKHNLELSFRSELLNAKLAVMKIQNFLRSANPSLTYEDQTDLKLVFSELLYNAVVHGNKGDSSKNVHLEVEFEDGMISGRITDEGSGFDYRELLRRMDDEDLFDECGRGIRLVYSLTDELFFNIAGNVIRFHKRVAAHG
jgi:serine/threonine-protein kinase RsbW